MPPLTNLISLLLSLACSLRFKVAHQRWHNYFKNLDLSSDGIPQMLDTQFV
jgi:hypothetical protein